MGHGRSQTLLLHVIANVFCKRRCLFLLLGLSLASSALAKDVRVGPVEGFFDLTLGYGALYRTESPADELVARANGGETASANADDGTLNYDTGLVSNMAALNAELTLSWDNVGLFVKTIGFYDWEQEDGDREHRAFGDRSLDRVGSDVEVRDLFLSGKFVWAGVPWHVRLGDQIINWGETTFVRDGVDTINPVDAIAAVQPARSLRDARVPQGMLWAAANLTETFSVEAFYQYDWEGVRVPAVGSFFSTNDLSGAGDAGFAQLSGATFSDLGTDLDAVFGTVPGTLGYDSGFLQVPEGQPQTPKDGGQFGVGILAVTRGANALKFGLHYTRYHSRLPVISGYTADAASVAATSSANVAARAADLVPEFLRAELAPLDAQAAADQAAASLSLSEYANAARYFVEYPEGIDMWAMTFNTATLRTGTLLSAEVSYHRDFPLQISIADVLAATLSPVEFDPSFAQGRLGAFGADELVRGVFRRDRAQLALSVTQLFGPRLGAAQTLLALDAAHIHIRDFPSERNLVLNAPEGGDANSWGYRIVGQLEYASVFGGLNLLPRAAFLHDVRGYTPAPISAFREDRKAVLVGVRAEFINRFVADLSYTNFFDGGKDNNLLDRDYVQLRLSVGF